MTDQTIITALISIITGLLGLGTGVKLGLNDSVKRSYCEMRHRDLEKLIDAKFSLILHELKLLNGKSTNEA